MESTVLIKAFQILEGFADVSGELSLADLARRVGQTKPTVHRILKTLVALGYVERSEGGVYRLGQSFRRLALGGEDRHLLEVAQPELRRLQARTGETVNLGVLRHDRVHYLKVIESTHPLRRVAEASGTDPCHTTALGRCIVAFLGDERRDFLIRSAKLEKRTPHSVVHREELRAILDQIRQAGYAWECDQTDVGVTCIGAPIRAAGEVCAAISVSGPTVRIDQAVRERLIEQTRRTAEGISRQLEKTRLARAGHAVEVDAASDQSVSRFSQAGQSPA